MKKSEKNGNLYAKHTARLMARMARDGETEELAEMIAELVDPENPDPAAEAAEEIPAETEAPDPVPVPEIREAEAEPCEHSIQEDCGERIVSLLQQIFSFLQSAADCGSPCGNPSRDEETPAESAEGREDPVETLVEEVIRETVQPDPAAFVNEALEAVLSDPGTGEEDSLSSVLSPEEEPAADRAADALRAAMSAFRPVLKTMAPDARRRVVQRIASDLRTRNRRRSGAASDTLAILKGSAGRVPSAGTDLGKRIMEKRNANLHRQA